MSNEQPQPPENNQDADRAAAAAAAENVASTSTEDLQRVLDALRKP